MQRRLQRCRLFWWLLLLLLPLLLPLLPLPLLPLPLLPLPLLLLLLLLLLVLLLLLLLLLLPRPPPTTAPRLATAPSPDTSPAVEYSSRGVNSSCTPDQSAARVAYSPTMRSFSEAVGALVAYRAPHHRIFSEKEKPCAMRAGRVRR